MCRLAQDCPCDFNFANKKMLVNQEMFMYNFIFQSQHLFWIDFIVNSCLEHVTVGFWSKFVCRNVHLMFLPYNVTADIPVEPAMGNAESSLSSRLNWEPAHPNMGSLSLSMFFSESSSWSPGPNSLLPSHSKFWPIVRDSSNWSLGIKWLKVSTISMNAAAFL